MSNNKSNYYFLFLISLAGFFGGLYFPLFIASGEILGFEISQEKITFFESIKILQEQSHRELALLLYGFVIILPSIKFLTILLNINVIEVLSTKFNSFLISLQKYAMVDVFVIALIAIASKSNPMFNIELQLGVYSLIVSVISGIILSVWIGNNSSITKSQKISY